MSRALALAATLLALAGALAAPGPRSGLPGPGRLLVARRGLPDPNFAETVVLLLGYGPRGAVGLVVNRPTEVPLAELLEGLDGLEGRPDRVWLGGPVRGGGIAMLVRSAEPLEDGEELLPGLQWSRSPELLERLVSAGDAGSPFRVFAGYAGWAPGQLDAEIVRGDWHLATLGADELFERPPETLWRALLPRAPDEWSLDTGPRAAARASRG